MLLLNTVNERISALQAKMKQKGIDIYYIPTSDDHNSEYTADKYMVRKFMSGFTGSAGTLIVTEDQAHLWTDGRYFVQAENQLKDSCITLEKMGQEGVPTVMEFIDRHVNDKSVIGLTDGRYFVQAENQLKDSCITLEKMGQEGVPTVMEFIDRHVNDKSVIGFDGNVVMSDFANQLKEKFKDRHIKLVYDTDLCDDLFTTRPELPSDNYWTRPELPSDNYWLLAERYTGESAASKVNKIRLAMRDKKVDVALLTQLEDVAYTTNLRGNEVSDTPVFYAYMLVTLDKATLYCDINKVSVSVLPYLNENGISIASQDNLVKDLASFKKLTIWADLSTTNVNLYESIRKDCSIVNESSAVVMMRAIKNPIETKNLRKAHILDGVAVTKFMYWLKQNVGKMDLDEYSAQEKLLEFRKEGSGFIEPSFTTICAYGANAAMMHYSAPQVGSTPIEKKDFLLVDSGGQYVYGTTDVTRTFVMGKTDKEHKKWYTIALRSYLELMNVKFLYGCSGLSLDCVARNPMWQYDMDYQCGTGHGVGYCLGVHEGPQGFRWRISPLRKEDAILEEGMVLTDEPGVYLPGVMGIRHENQVIVAKGKKNEYGQFMHLENLTMVPIDLDGVDTKYLTEDDINILNNYHALVYRNLNRYFKGKELAWLKKATRKISK